MAYIEVGIVGIAALSITMSILTMSRGLQRIELNQIKSNQIESNQIRPIFGLAGPHARVIRMEVHLQALAGACRWTEGGRDGEET